MPFQKYLYQAFLGFPIGEAGTIEVGLQKLHVDRFRKNNPEYEEFTDDEIADFIAKNVLLFIDVFNEAANLLMARFSEVVENQRTKAFLDTVLNEIVEKLSKESVIFNDFEQAIVLFTGTYSEVQSFISKETKAFKRSLDSLVEKQNLYLVEYLFEKDIFTASPNPTERLRYYSTENVRLSSHLQQHKKKLKKINSYKGLLTFYREAIGHFKNILLSEQNEFLQTIKGNLASPLKDIKETEGPKKTNGENQIIPKCFEDLFYPTYKINADRFIKILQNYTQEENINLWKGHKAWARVFYDHLVKKKVFYGHNVNPNTPYIRKQHVAQIFAQKFEGLGEHILLAKESSARLDQKLITQFKTALTVEAEKCLTPIKSDLQ